MRNNGSSTHTTSIENGDVAASEAASERRRARRSRWAAIGAAIAVTLGGGGLVAVDAASGAASSTVTIDPIRIMDTRDPLDLGLPGPFVSAVGLDLQVTGEIPTVGGDALVVPRGATGAILNVTVVRPQADGFVSVRPADATGRPTTSNLNLVAGQVTPNVVIVQLPTAGAEAGAIEITYDAGGQAGPTADILVDVMGYFVEGSAGVPGPEGDRGPIGPVGPTGPKGDTGSSVGGVDFVSGPSVSDIAVGSDTIVATLEIQVPEAGFITMTGTALITLANGTTGACSLDLDGVPRVSQGFNIAGDNGYANTFGLAVSAGSYTIEMMCQQYSGVSSMDVLAPTISLVYSPTQI